MQAVRGALGIVTGLLRPAGASSLTGPVTSMRRYAAGEVSLDDVDTVCQEFGVTVNDVALAAITDSFRNTLIRRGEAEAGRAAHVGAGVGAPRRCA